MTHRFWRLFAVSVTGGAMSWIALQSWRPLIEEPGRFVGPAFTGTLIVVLIGTFGRNARLPFYAVAPIQVVALLLWLQHRLDPDPGLSSWFPSAEGMRRIVEAVASGAAAINTYASPVGARHTHASFYLLVTGLLVILAVDLIACGLRQAPWAGLPIVVALTVPISVLETRLSWFVLAGTAILFTLLLAAQQIERVAAWEHALGRAPRKDSVVGEANGTALRAGALRIGFATAVGALVLPVLVPVTDGLFGSGNGSGSGTGSGDKTVRLVNPMIGLHASLVALNHTPLLTATTDDPDTGYLRTTVLDRFDGDRWKPSQRDMPARNKVDGALPPPPGLASLVGNSHEWSLRVSRAFETSWIPAPSPLRALRVSAGDWRYDRRTMDFANTDDRAPAGFSYTATAVHPGLTAARLRNAGEPPTSVSSPMTDLPRNIPPIVFNIAEQVTSSGRTTYEKAVLLQNWFRTEGGFTYSLDPERNPGSSMDALVDFITTTKDGYCEQYAAAMGIMARSLGIPTRVAIGFLRPDDRDRGSLVYTSDTLHAWPEIYFVGSGWVRFEPTPGGRTGDAPSWTEENAAPTPTSAPVPTTAPTGVDPGTRGAERPEAVSTDSASRTTPMIWGGVILVLLVAGTVPALVRRRLRARRLDLNGPAAADRVAADLWTELIATADDLRIPLPTGRSLREVTRELASSVDAGPDMVDDLAILVAFLEAAFYGRPYEVPRESRASMDRVVRAWCRAMSASVTRGRRIGAVIAPRSILGRQAPRGLPPVGRRDQESVGVGEIG